MRTLVVTLTLALVAGAQPLRAQQDQAAVLTVVKRVFDGMRTRDTALMRAQFAPSARLLSIDAKTGKPEIKTMDPSGWIGAVGKGSGPAWDERTFDPVVEQDDNIAHVWTYYEFWLGPKLSHCGYDSFFLVKLTDGWKVTQVADTRHTDCKPR
jgi:hypothetical protein